MSDEPKKRSRAWIAWVTIGLLGLYPLSIGPAARISTHAHSHAFTEAYFAAYAPIFRIWDKPIGHPLFLYVAFWSSLPPAER
ncbi:MAG TPA: hypothetical protein VG055_28980 [Planctomycetaceae bacterium]|jgi:hypothetical protein|nr:hypothetical protein [Planctomycetaceae bacterium]